MDNSVIRALRGPILIIGAGGFVGANLFLKISAIRNDVYAVVRQRPAWRLATAIPDRILEVDITDESASINLIDQILPQTVFDCISYGAYSFEDRPELIYETNFTAIMKFLEHLAKKPFTAYLHAGSSSEYGLNSSAPVEASSLLPNSHYAVSKAGISHYIHYAGSVLGKPMANLRLYSVFGPLEDTSRLMPTIIRMALKKEYPPFVNPDITRDFVFIDDVCEAFILAAVRMNPQMYGKSYNIGSGRSTSIRELALITGDLFDIKSLPEFGSMPDRKWDLRNWYSDPSLAKSEFGWSARTELREGMVKMREWVASISDQDQSQYSKAGKSKRKRSVSAIVACYRDEQAIPLMHERLTKVFNSIGCDYEIILVNDCSPDDSARVIRELSATDRKVLGISHSRNFGSQMAFRSGMELSTKDSVVLLDGDLQDPPELIEQLYASWEQGNDVIYGRRVKRDMPLLWGLAYKAFYRVFAAFSYIKIPHDAGDFSLIDRKVVGWMLACPERDLFMRGLRAFVGFRQSGIDYIRPERQFGRSTNSLLKNIGWAKKGIFSYSRTPLDILSAMGVLLLILSVFAASIVTFLRLAFPDLAPRGATTIIICILFFGSLNLMAIGIVGEYIGKILEEVKKRPRLIRSGIIRNGTISELLPDGSIRR